MMCDSCGARASQITFNVLFAGKKVVRNYCAQCARMIRRGDALGVQMAVLNSLSSENTEAAPVCPKCGATVDFLQRTGRVGCAACYRAFGAATEELLKKLNGTERQMAEAVTETPVLSETQQKLRALRDELAQAVSVENYERAAVLRDEINALFLLDEEEETQE